MTAPYIAMALQIGSLKRRARRTGLHSLEQPLFLGIGKWVCLVGIFLLTVFLTAPYFYKRLPRYQEGQVLPTALRAFVTFTWESTRRVQEWEEERRHRHERVYAFDSRVEEEVTQRVEALVQLGMEYPDSPRFNATWRARMLSVLPQAQRLSDRELIRLLQLMNDERFADSIHAVTDHLYGQFYLTENRNALLGYIVRDVFRPRPAAGPLPERVTDRNVLSYPDQTLPMMEQLFSERISGTTLSVEDSGRMGVALLEMLVRPNLTLDEAGTREAYQRYPRPNLRTVVRAGDELFAAGHRLTSTDREVLLAHREAVLSVYRLRFFGNLTYVGIVFAIIAFYVRNFERELTFNTRNLLLISVPVLLALVISFFFIMLDVDRSLLAAGLFPAGIIGMLGVLLLDVRMALLLVTWGCLLFGLQADLDYKAVIVNLFAGYAAVGALYTLRERREVMIAGLLIGLVISVILLTLDFIEAPGSLSAASTWTRAMVGFIAGFFCALITISVLPLFEVTMGITTDMRLLELSGLRHPLLRKLEAEAPGTWQHTLNVAKLAEAAAIEIGANYLLVRTGCYFHDIGKMTKPEFFTENQLTREDKMRHHVLKPQMSTLIIKNHVKEGIELAREAGLPQRIIDFIAQHHGNGLIVYFYHKAMSSYEKGESKEPVRQEDYRYAGPKPQSIEAAIVLLADSVEATATAKLSGRTVREDEIRQLVRTIVFDRFNDGQFDECNLTMRDLNIIRESLIRTLISRFHTRIDYPKAPSSQSAVKRT